MDTRPAIATATVLIAALALVAGPAAAEPDDDAGVTGDEASSGDESGDDGADDEAGDASTDDEEPAARSAATSDYASAAGTPTDDRSPVELMGETYYFVGARYRALVVPKFIPKMFADGGISVVVHAVGPEFGIRKDGFEIVLSPWRTRVMRTPSCGAVSMR